MSHCFGVKCACGDFITYERLRGSVHLPDARLLAKYAGILARLGRELRELNTRVSLGGGSVSFQVQIGSGGMHDESAEVEWFGEHEEHGGFVACIDYGETYGP